MKIESSSNEDKDNSALEFWKQLAADGIHIYPVTPCQNRCLLYANKQHRKVFFTEVQPEGPWLCSECGAERRKNEVVVDHIDHIHNGFGSHNCPENLRALCGKCNSRHNHRPDRICGRCGPKSPEHREAISEAHLKFWEQAGSEFVEQRRKSGREARAAMTEDQVSAGSRKRSSKFWNESPPEKILERNQKLKDSWDDPSPARQADVGDRPERNRRTWQDPATRARRTAGGYHGAAHVQKGVFDPSCEFCLRSRET